MSLTEQAQKLVELAKVIDAKESTDKTYKATVALQFACDQLLASALGPSEFVTLIAESCHESKALHLVTTAGVADIIGDGEAHLDAIAEQAGLQVPYLAAAMICISGRGFFDEIGNFGSRTYKNNDVSSVLRKTNPKGISNAVGFIGDEAFRAVSRLSDAGSVKSPLPKGESALNVAFDFKGSPWDWLAEPDNKWRTQRIGNAMKELHGFANINVVHDYDWSAISTPLVDLGGGIGALEMQLSKQAKYNNLNFVILDTPATAANGEKFWQGLGEASVKRTTFVQGDFTQKDLEKSKIPKDAGAYLIRHVLHDWSDSQVVDILSNVRGAMSKTSRLLLCEIILTEKSPRLARSTSVQALAMLGGIERTLDEYTVLLQKAGFKVDRLVEMRALDSIIEASIA